MKANLQSLRPLHRALSLTAAPQTLAPWRRHHPFQPTAVPITTTAPKPRIAYQLPCPGFKKQPAFTSYAPIELPREAPPNTLRRRVENPNLPPLEFVENYEVLDMLEEPLENSLEEWRQIQEDQKLRARGRAQAKRQHLEKLRELVLSTAVHLGTKVGKWMLFPADNSVDSVWREIEKATLSGELGAASQLWMRGEMSEDNEFECETFIGVYTTDFTDTLDVKRVHGKLQELGVCDGLIAYKPNIYSILGLIKGNKYHLPPSIYTSKSIERLGDNPPPKEFDPAIRKPGGLIIGESPERRSARSQGHMGQSLLAAAESTCVRM